MRRMLFTNQNIANAALRGAATLKARTMKEVCNIAAVLPVEKNLKVENRHSRNGSYNGEANQQGENFLGLCSEELLARGSELLKRTRTGSYKILWLDFTREDFQLFTLLIELFHLFNLLIQANFTGRSSQFTSIKQTRSSSSKIYSYSLLLSSLLSQSL